jgi:hypothetical protein
VTVVVGLNKQKIFFLFFSGAPVPSVDLSPCAFSDSCGRFLNKKLVSFFKEPLTPVPSSLRVLSVIVVDGFYEIKISFFVFFQEPLSPVLPYLLVLSVIVEVG